MIDLPTPRDVLAARPADPGAGHVIGRSREGREMRAFRFGAPSGGSAHDASVLRVSLIAGCHADEPVGPALLRRLVAYLGVLPEEHGLLHGYEWWIVPHANPDGEAVNAVWEGGLAGSKKATAGAVYDPVSYLTHVVRELPGDDVEFCFPRGPDDPGGRPENRAIYDWWRADGRPFHMHASLHGMAMSAGPYFLLDAGWHERCAGLKARCAAEVERMGYTLHDVERHGEKGFHRIERGFATRPDSRAMRDHFLALGEKETAARFRPSSMETVRSLGGDCLTVVSEMPLFITPGVGETLGPPDPVREAWLERRARWSLALRAGRSGPAADTEEASAAEAEIRASELRPMPIDHQMALQWTLVCAAIEEVRRARGG